MNPFADRLRAIQAARNSLLCVGLDTDVKKLPASVRDAADPVHEFNRRIVEATADVVAAYKINLAFYEAMGDRGWPALRRTIALVPEGILVIGDAKRGDIGNTAEMYAASLRDDLKFGASTVNPYMGSDAVEPFLRDPSHGVFLLALTSNPGARDFQYLASKGVPLYEQVVRKAKRWNTRGNVGLVVGATRPAQLKRIRSIAPQLPILIPGVGAQGGDLRAAVRYGCTAQGDLALINASRAVLYASGGADFAEAAHAAARTLRDDINSFRRRAG